MSACRKHATRETREDAVNKVGVMYRVGAGLAVVWLAGPTALGAAGTAASWSSTRVIQVTDPQYQMTAFTVAVPAGWKSAAAVAHNSGCHGTGSGLQSTVQSPDGATTIAYLPGVRWTWVSSPLEREQLARANCAAIDIDSAASFLLNIAIPNLRPGAAVTAVLPLPPAGQESLRKQMDTA